MLTASSLALAAVEYARFYQAEPAPVVGTAKYPESLCLMLALPSSGRRVPPLRGHYSPFLALTDSCPNPVWLSPPSVCSLVRGVCAGCYQALLPPGSSRRYPESLSCDAWASATTVCRLLLPVASSASSAFPNGKWVGLPFPSAKSDFTAGDFSQAAAIS